MFGIGYPELMVLAIVGVIVLGPERLPGLARDAARLLRTLRDLATGAREQLRDELGPEFADVDLRNLNPRTALTRAVFGDDEDFESLRKMDPRRWNAREAATNFVNPDRDEDGKISFDKRPDGAGGRTDPASGGTLRSTNGSSAGSANGSSANRSSANGSSANGSSANGSSANGSRPRPRPRPGPATPYDSDAT